MTRLLFKLKNLSSLKSKKNKKLKIKIHVLQLQVNKRAYQTFKYQRFNSVKKLKKDQFIKY